MFEWNELKSAANLEKHGVSFKEASTVFLDADALDGPDLTHSLYEERFLRIGLSLLARVLVVSYTLRSHSHVDNKIRIISARKASRKERKVYEKKN